jgi:hypothetical protein
MMTKQIKREITDLERRRNALWDQLLCEHCGSELEPLCIQCDIAHKHDRLVAALLDLIGQVEQARDGFGIWPYADSNSMANALEQAKRLVAPRVTSQE